MLGPGKDLSEGKSHFRGESRKNRIDIIIIISRLKRKIIPEKGTLANPDDRSTGPVKLTISFAARLGWGSRIHGSGTTEETPLLY